MFDEEIEKAILYYIIFENEEFKLDEKDFVNNDNKKIIKAINDLKARKEDVSILTVKNKIEERYIKHGDTFFNKAILDYIETKELTEQKNKYKEIEMTEEEYLKKIENGGKKYV